MTERSMTFTTGGMWGESDWRIDFDVEVCAEYGAKPCPHCSPVYLATEGDYSGLSVFVCPRVVVTSNEGGYNTTGVCLDCVLDAVKLVSARDSTGEGG